MTDLTDLQRRTLEIISMHPANKPVTGKEVAIQIGLKARATGKEGADMRSIIHALQVKGYPVCASGRGYWYPSDGDELKAYIGSLKARATMVQEAVDGLKCGYALVGQAKAQEAVKVATKVRFIAKKDGIRTAFEISEANIEAFMEQYPDAERL
jgi:hypothetical protein